MSEALSHWNLGVLKNQLTMSYEFQEPVEEGTGVPSFMKVSKVSFQDIYG